MENKKFDDFIKQSLEHLDGEDFIPMDWSSMNEQLDADGLDEAMKGSLENLEGADFRACKTYGPLYGFKE